MLKKETFVKAMQAIEMQEKMNESVTKALEPMCEGNGFFFDGGSITTHALVQVLRETMHDTDDWISWYLFENPPHIYFTDEEHEMKSVEELYDFLIKRYQKEKTT